MKTSSRGGRKYCPPEDPGKCGMNKAKTKCGKPNPWIEFRVLYKGRKDNNSATYQRLKAAGRFGGRMPCRMNALRSDVLDVPEVRRYYAGRVRWGEEEEVEEAQAQAQDVRKRARVVNLAQDFVRKLRSRSHTRVQRDIKRQMLGDRATGMTDAEVDAVDVGEIMQVREGSLQDRVRAGKYLTNVFREEFKGLSVAEVCKIERNATHRIIGGKILMPVATPKLGVGTYGSVYQYSRDLGLRVQEMAVKVSTVDDRIHLKAEKIITNFVTDMLVRGVTQHLPVTFYIVPASDGAVCRGRKRLADGRTKDDFRQVYFMERLTETVSGLQSKSADDKRNAYIQILAGMAALEQEGLYTNDTKHDNVMGLKTTPGGCWHYEVFDASGAKTRDVYVPNLGVVWCLFDFSLVTNRTGVSGYVDRYKKRFPGRVVEVPRHLHVLAQTFAKIGYPGMYNDLTRPGGAVDRYLGRTHLVFERMARAFNMTAPSGEVINRGRPFPIRPSRATSTDARLMASRFYNYTARPTRPSITDFDQ